MDLKELFQEYLKEHVKTVYSKYNTIDALKWYEILKKQIEIIQLNKNQIIHLDIIFLESLWSYKPILQYIINELNETSELNNYSIVVKPDNITIEIKINVNYMTKYDIERLIREITKIIADNI